MKDITIFLRNLVRFFEKDNRTTAMIFLSGVLYTLGYRCVGVGVYYYEYFHVSHS